MKLKPNLAGLALWVLAGLQLASPAHAQLKKFLPRRTNTAPIKAAMRQLVQQNQLPGVMLVVVKGNKVVFNYSQGYSDLGKHKQHLKGGNLYALGSCTEPFVALAMLHLAVHERLRLDGPVLTWFPNLGAVGEEGELKGASPTVLELLSHTSGISPQAMDGLPTTGTLADATELVEEKSLLSLPGVYFRHAPANYLLAGRIEESTATQDAERHLQATILNPLSCYSTTYHPTGKLAKHRAQVYQLQGKGWALAQQQPPLPLPGQYPNVGNGLYSTPRDLTKLMRYYARFGLNLDEKMDTPLPVDSLWKNYAANVGDLENDPIGKLGKGYGLGWALQEVSPLERGLSYFQASELGPILWGDKLARLGIVWITAVPREQSWAAFQQLLPLVRTTFTRQQP